MSDAPPAEDEGGGVPAWVMTFADLMTLLMCFFVLLLAFSEMDAAKFKQLSGSMKDAFGVQSEIEVRTIPKGTSVVAQEFSPGRPDPTSLNQVRQFTIDSNRNSLDALSEAKDVRDLARRIRAALQAEIEKGDVAVETRNMKVTIHLMENASFDSGKADLHPAFLPVLTKIGGLIDNNVGEVTVSGHTDNIPIASNNEQFRSNWDLSTTRAVTVTHALLGATTAAPGRFTVTGHADTRPRVANDSRAHRAKNRRVEISIVRGNTNDRDQQLKLNEAIRQTTTAKEASS